MDKKQLIVISIIFILFGILGCASVQKGSLGDESWTVEKRNDRIFYFTHGTAVWGHEFGFYKTDDCGGDFLWLSFSTSDEKVKNLSGKEALISLNIDSKDFKIKSTMRYMGTIGFTQVMYFFDRAVGPELMNVLTKGYNVKVQIIEPKELEALLDIKYDEFSLKGLAASRKEAEKVCKDSLSVKKKRK
jgi:hypothetical protein